MALVKIGKAAKLLGVEVQTLHAWERSGELIPDRRSKSGIRYYDVSKIPGLGNGTGNEDLPTIGYARVPGPGREADLTRQEESLEAFWAAKGCRHEIISDSGPGSGSGSNHGNKGLKRLIELILRKRIHRLVVTHRDRLSRFGSELIFTLCEQQNVEVVIANRGDPPTVLDEEELAQDIEIRRLCDRLVKDERASSDPMPETTPVTTPERGLE
jgi:predicted site-specific integrase-resolvase